MIRVLLAEDEDIIRKGISQIIARLGDGFQVCSECRNGEEAWDAVQKEHPDIVITDIRMRRMSGLELVEKIREYDDALPIIIVSGYSEFSYAQTALRFGVTDYFVKPINVSELVNVLLKTRDKLEPQQKKHAPEADGSHVVRQIKEYVRDHISEELSLSMLSDALEKTPNYLSTLFKNETGENFSAYILHKRMEKAKGMLKGTNLKVYEICEACGMKNVKYFNACFKKETGKTPQEYRNKHGEDKT